MNEEKKADELATIVEHCFIDGEEGTNEQFRSCVIEKSGTLNPECKSQVVLIAEPGCGGCDEAHRALKPYIESSKVHVIDASSVAGEAILRQLKKNAVPVLALTDCNGELLAELEI